MNSWSFDTTPQSLNHTLLTIAKWNCFLRTCFIIDNIVTNQLQQFSIFNQFKLHFGKQTKKESWLWQKASINWNAICLHMSFWLIDLIKLSLDSTNHWTSKNLNWQLNQLRSVLSLIEQQRFQHVNCNVGDYVKALKRKKSKLSDSNNTVNPIH